MDNETLLQRCETLETDFNACNTFDEKRDFVKQFLGDVEPDFITCYNKWYSKKYSTNDIKTDKEKEFFNDAPEFEIKQDACNLAKELLQSEFYKIEKVVIIDLIASIFIYVCRRQNQNLNEISNLIKDNSQNAISEFEILMKESIKKDDYSFRYLIDEIIEKYKVGDYTVLNFERVMDAIEYDLESFGLRIGELYSDNQFFITGEDLAPKIITKIDRILNTGTIQPATPKSPTNGNEIVNSKTIRKSYKNKIITVLKSTIAIIAEISTLIISICWLCFGNGSYEAIIVIIASVSFLIISILSRCNSEKENLKQ